MCAANLRISANHLKWLMIYYLYQSYGGYYHDILTGRNWDMKGFIDLPQTDRYEHLTFYKAYMIF